MSRFFVVKKEVVLQNDGGENPMRGKSDHGGWGETGRGGGRRGEGEGDETRRRPLEELTPSKFILL